MNLFVTSLLTLVLAFILSHIAAWYIRYRRRPARRIAQPLARAQILETQRQPPSQRQEEKRQQAVRQPLYPVISQQPLTIDHAPSTVMSNSHGVSMTNSPHRHNANTSGSVNATHGLNIVETPSPVRLPTQEVSHLHGKRSHGDDVDDIASEDEHDIKKVRIQGDEKTDARDDPTWTNNVSQPRGSKRNLDSEDEGGREKRRRHSVAVDSEAQVLVYDPNDSSSSMQGVVEHRRGKKRGRSSAASTVFDEDMDDSSKSANWKRKRTSLPTPTVSSRGTKRDREVEDDASDEEIALSAGGSRKKRGRKSSRTLKMRKAGEEWECGGMTYKMGSDGRRLCKALLIKDINKFHMPKDSVHPDGQQKFEVCVEKWLTDEEYENARIQGLFPTDNSTVTISSPDGEFMDGVLWSMPPTPTLSSGRLTPVPEQPPAPSVDVHVSSVASATPNNKSRVGRRLSSFELIESSNASRDRTFSSPSPSMLNMAENEDVETSEGSGDLDSLSVPRGRTYSRWQKAEYEARLLLRMRKEKEEAERKAKESALPLSSSVPTISISKPTAPDNTPSSVPAPRVTFPSSPSLPAPESAKLLFPKPLPTAPVNSSPLKNSFVPTSASPSFSTDTASAITAASPDTNAQSEPPAAISSHSFFKPAASSSSAASTEAKPPTPLFSFTKLASDPSTNGTKSNFFAVPPQKERSNLSHPIFPLDEPNKAAAASSTTVPGVSSDSGSKATFFTLTGSAPSSSTPTATESTTMKEPEGSTNKFMLGLGKPPVVGDKDKTASIPTSVPLAGSGSTLGLSAATPAKESTPASSKLMFNFNLKPASEGGSAVGSVNSAFSSASLPKPDVSGPAATTTPLVFNLQPAATGSAFGGYKRQSSSTLQAPMTSSTFDSSTDANVHESVFGAPFKLPDSESSTTRKSVFDMPSKMSTPDSSATAKPSSDFNAPNGTSAFSDKTKSVPTFGAGAGSFFGNQHKAVGASTPTVDARSNPFAAPAGTPASGLFGPKPSTSNAGSVFGNGTAMAFGSKPTDVSASSSSSEAPKSMFDFRGLGNSSSSKPPNPSFSYKPAPSPANPQTPSSSTAATDKPKFSFNFANTTTPANSPGIVAGTTPVFGSTTPVFGSTTPVGTPTNTSDKPASNVFGNGNSALNFAKK